MSKHVLSGVIMCINLFINKFIWRPDHLEKYKSPPFNLQMVDVGSIETSTGITSICLGNTSTNYYHGSGC